MYKNCTAPPIKDLARYLGSIAAVFCLTGCPTIFPAESDGGIGEDGSLPGASLLVLVEADVGEPLELRRAGPHYAQINELSEVRLELEDFRIIGDSVPGDERTTLDELVLDWRDGPLSCLEFQGAPPGIYSRVRASMRAYRIVGAIEDSGVNYAFSIEDTPPQGIAMTADINEVIVDVDAGGEIALQLDMEYALDAIDWEAHDSDGDGQVEIDADSPEIAEFRARMATLLQPVESPLNPSSCEEVSPIR